MKNIKKLNNFISKINLINKSQLILQYFKLKPNFNIFYHRIKFGTSGHRGSSEKYNFNQNHILSIVQSIIEERRIHNINGPCYLSKDTHAISYPAFISALEVLYANNIKVIIQKNKDYTPTPSISYSILNHKNKNEITDGILITPSHNPPEDGGIKYNYCNGGPAKNLITKSIEIRANKYLKNNLIGVKKTEFKKIKDNSLIIEKNLINPYVENLFNVIDMKSIKISGLKIGVHPLGSSGIKYWQYISKYYSLNLFLMSTEIDHTFKFVPLDYDKIIRIDCSSSRILKNLFKKENKFDLYFTNDPDCDRYGIFTKKGFIHPNKFLVVAIDYLFKNRSLWDKEISIGKTFISSTIIDCISKKLNKNVIETPVGFKWFVDGLFNKKIGFCGEESAGGSFLRFNGDTWSTDKDGFIMCLLAAEITAVTGIDLHQYYNNIQQKLFNFSYNIINITINDLQKNILEDLNIKNIKKNKLLGDKIIKHKSFGYEKALKNYGYKACTKNGWFAIRISGTENICKIYCESFINNMHRIKIEKKVKKLIYKIINK